MNDVKPAWKSKSMWGGVFALIALVLQSTGVVDVSVKDQTTLVDILVQVIEYGGVLFAMYGRYVAKCEIGW